MIMNGASPCCERTVTSPFGILTLESDSTSVTALRFGDHRRGLPSCPVLEQAAVELAEYFSGARREFSVPLSPRGTLFQQSVWAELRAIPYGNTAAYADIAARLGNPNACRAVGNANNRNPLPIFIPCHRVVGKNGSLTGYASGLTTKLFLLNLEGASMK